MHLLELKDVCKRYPGSKKNVVDKINLSIDEGDFLVLVGPSGCGKSTTLRMIAGLEDITEGDFFFEGKRYNDTSPQKRGFSMVFQNYALYPFLTVFENIAFSLRIRHVNNQEIKQRVQETAEMLELENLLQRYPSQLSGGQKQRVAIGSAIVRKPKLLLMDEPLSNLDAKLREQMRIVLARVHAHLKNTIIYVTHDQIEAMTLGTRIVVLDSGVVQQADSPEKIYQHPVNLFTASFIGSPPINLLTGRIVERHEQYNVHVSNALFPLDRAVAEELLALGYGEKDLILGLRPASFQVIPTAGVDDLTVEVTGRELLGGKMILYTENKDNTITVSCPVNYDLKVGDQIALKPSLVDANYFDGKTEENILQGKPNLERSHA